MTMFLLDIMDPYTAPAEISTGSKEKVHLEAIYFSTAEKKLKRSCSLCDSNT